MSLPDVDCMTCLMAMARGLKTEDERRIQFNGVTHAVRYPARPDGGTTACGFGFRPRTTEDE